MKSTIRDISTAAFIALLICSFGTAVAFAGQPGPAKSEFLETVGGGFLAERQQDGQLSCRYALSIQARGAHPGTLYLRTRFENPQDRANPFVVESEIRSGTKTFVLQSPLIRGIRARHNYKVEIVVFDSSTRLHQIDRLIQKVQSPLNL
jgi:hypothetical protein